MIIGLAGKMGSGKNTVAEMISQLFPDYGWEFKAFAYKVKQFVSILTGCTMEQLEDRKFKNSNVPKEWRVWIVNDGDPECYGLHYFHSEEAAKYAVYNEDGDLNIYDDSAKIYSWLPTYRELLQRIGTDLFRHQLHPNTWINATFADYKFKAPVNYYGSAKVYDLENIIYPNWLITDVRFVNEAQAIQDRGGIVIKLTRNLDNKDTHASEAGVDDIIPDIIIDNANDTLQETREKVKHVLLTHVIPTIKKAS